MAPFWLYVPHTDDAHGSGSNSVSISGATEQLAGEFCSAAPENFGTSGLFADGGEVQGTAMPVWTGTAVPEESGIGEGRAGAHCRGDVLQHRTGQPGQNRLRSWQPSPMLGPAAGIFSVPE